MGYSLISRFSAKRLFFSLAATLLLFCVGPGIPETHAAWGEFTIKDEVELGKQIRASVRSSLPIVDDPEIQAYADELLARIMAAAPPQPFVFSISVIRHNAINAFAAPGGNLFLFTGLILTMEHESEVAGVLAHEVAHATQRHIASRIEKMQKISMLSLAGALIGGFLGGDAGSALAVGSLAAGQSAQLYHSRADETDADHVGMGYFTKAGYPPRGMVGAFEKIRRQQWLLGSSIPTYLSTHPAVQDRIQSMSVRIQSLPENIRNRKDDDAKFKRIQTLIRARFSDSSQAMAAFNKQVEENGSNRCLALMGQGIVHSRNNRITDAELAFDKALSCAASEPLIAREAGIFHYRRGSRDKASDLLSQALKLNSKDHVARFYHARLQSDSGNFQEAQENYKRILLALPEDAEVHFFYAQSLGKNNQLFKAYLHMAYSSLYSNDKKKTQQNHDRAKNAAKTPQEQADLKRLDEAFKERQRLFEGK